MEVNHPKYTLLLAGSVHHFFPYVIMEHMATFDADGKVTAIGSREVSRYSTLQEALDYLMVLSSGPILIASSSQSIDNTFVV